jgi:hypothetical protein
MDKQYAYVRDTTNSTRERAMVLRGPRGLRSLTSLMFRRAQVPQRYSLAMHSCSIPVHHALSVSINANVLSCIHNWTLG